MKKMSILVILLLAGAASAAEEPVGFTLGFGPAGLLLTSESPLDDETLTGLGLAGTFAINDGLAFRGAVHILDHKDRDDVEVRGMEAQMLAGRGFLEEGLRYYAGLGFFEEDWHDPRGNQRIGGLTLGLGGGWAWSKVVCELWTAWRTSESYHGEFADYSQIGDRNSFTGALSLSYRF